MRGLILSLVCSCLLLAAECGPAGAQQPPEKKETPAAKYEREGSSMLVPYTLAGIGIVIVMILVCMPVRRD
jgi:hypothetical protein